MRPCLAPRKFCRRRSDGRLTLDYAIAKEGHANYRVQQFYRWPSAKSKKPRALHHQHKSRRRTSVGSVRERYLVSTVLLQCHLWWVQYHLKRSAGLDGGNALSRRGRMWLYDAR